MIKVLSILCLVLTTVSAQDAAMSDALRKVSGQLTSVKTAKTQIAQRLEQDKESPYRATFVISETDSKGKTTEETYFLNIADLDPASVAYKTDKDVITVGVSAQQKRKFIRHTNNGEANGFTDHIQLYAENSEVARGLTNALRQAVLMANKNFRAENLPDNFDGLALWLKSNIGPERVGTDTYDQQLTFDRQNPLRAIFRVTHTDAKGRPEDQDEFSMNIGDLNTDELKLNVNRNQLELALGIRNRQKFIAYRKMDKTADNVSAFEIVSIDPDRIRNVETAWRKLISLAQKKIESQRPALNTMADVQKYMRLGGGIAQNGEKTIEQALQPDCICTITRKESGGRNPTQEVYVLNLADLNDKQVALTVDDDQFVLKLPLRNNQRYVSYYKNGVRQSYTDEVKLVGNDLERMRYLPAAFIKASQLCAQNQKSPVPRSGSHDVLVWLMKQIPTFRNETDELRQVLTDTEGSGCLLRFTMTQTGKRTNEFVYDLNLKDLNADLSEVVVTGQNVFVRLATKAGAKTIKAQKDGKPDNYVNSVRIQIDDVEKARGIVTAYQQLIKACGN